MTPRPSRSTMARMDLRPGDVVFYRTGSEQNPLFRTRVQRVTPTHIHTREGRWDRATGRAVGLHWYLVPTETADTPEEYHERGERNRARSMLGRLDSSVAACKITGERLRALNEALAPFLEDV